MTSGTAIDPALRAVAEAWRDDDPDPHTVAEVDRLLAEGDGAGLRDRFGASLRFGTAGLRAPLGAGPNRMNRAVVRRAALAVGRWLDDHDVDGPVVVGRDARHRSDDFAADTARVIAATGREVVLAHGPVPTPLLAFAVGALGGAAGIMVTASHNPPGDNGYKVYAGDGAQIVPPADHEIADHLDAVGAVAAIALAPLQDETIRPLPDHVVSDYLDGIAGLRVVPRSPAATVAYSPLHGVAGALLVAAFARAGLRRPVVVAEQAEPDPDFPTVAFPNPEEPGAMDLLLALASRDRVDVALANDPDGDRLAVAVPAGSDRWRALSGDEVGVLLADHLLRHGQGSDRLVVTTIVSSTMLARLAEAHTVHHVETLTGFKWLARAAMARPDLRFVIGYEEALGYSIGSLVRDKDGISAAVVFAELIGSLAAAGSSVLRRLDELAVEHGVHATRQWSTRFEGLHGPDRMAARVDRLRTDPPTALGGVDIATMEDLALGERLPPTDAVVLRGTGLRVVVRPSGTEPKLKAYVEVVHQVTDDVTGARSAADGTLDAVLADLTALLA